MVHQWISGKARYQSGLCVHHLKRLGKMESFMFFQEWTYLPTNSLLEISETNGAISGQSVLHPIMAVDPRPKHQIEAISKS